MFARRLLAISIALAASLVPSATASAAELLQPGARILTSAGTCSLNFLYQGNAGMYFGTAAHCVQGVGEVVKDADGVAIGDIALRGLRVKTEDDWALIKVRAGVLGRVQAGIAGSQKYPRGVSTPALGHLLDPLQFSGWGLGLNLLQFTRERRVGVLLRQTNTIYQALGAITGGDSGSPIADVRTGLAVGTVSRVCLADGACTVEGPTVQDVIGKAAALGLAVHLVTV